MKILFLDDMEPRHKLFKAKYGEKYDVTYVYSYDEFEKAYEDSEEDFDVLFLDHDLSEKSIMCDPETFIEEATGTDVADWLVGYYSESGTKPVVYCHSLNPAGAENMRHILSVAGFEVKKIPFFLLVA